MQLTFWAWKCISLTPPHKMVLRAIFLLNCNTKMQSIWNQATNIGPSIIVLTIIAGLIFVGSLYIGPQPYKYLANKYWGIQYCLANILACPIFLWLNICGQEDCGLSTNILCHQYCEPQNMAYQYCFIQIFPSPNISLADISMVHRPIFSRALTRGWAIPPLIPGEILLDAPILPRGISRWCKPIVHIPPGDNRWACIFPRGIFGGWCFIVLILPGD